VLAHADLDYAVDVKDSGWGRSGPASMHDFTEIQWITTREGTGHFPI
jgi:hypothetical protein